jgi:hypothetical protein
MHAAFAKAAENRNYQAVDPLIFPQQRKIRKG